MNPTENDLCNKADTFTKKLPVSESQKTENYVQNDAVKKRFLDNFLTDAVQVAEVFAEIISIVFKPIFNPIAIVSGTYDVLKSRGLNEGDFDVSHLQQRILSLEKEAFQAHRAIDASTVTEQLAERLSKDIQEETLNILERKYSAETLNRNALESLNKIFRESQIRLSKARQSIALRSFLNLLVGISIAAFGALVLFEFVETSDELFSSKDYFYIVSASTSRLALVILVQVFAYFFLNLYRAGLQEIKYYENELTNSLSQEAAIKTALLCGSSDLIDKAVGILMSIEKNGILKQGESTVTLEQLKIERHSDKQLADSITKTVETALQNRDQI